MAKGYYKRVVERLREAGYHYVRQGKGDHEIWFSPHSNHHFVVDGVIKSRQLANAVMKQAGLDKAF